MSAQVTGVVTDENDLPVPGVNVLLKSQKGIGTVSDIDGNFSINAAVGDTLIFSFLGFTDIERVVGDGSSLNIKMAEASELLDEVVVIGYGSVQKDDLTGVVQKVSEKDFIQTSISSPEKLISGKVAGLQISSNGEPGGATEIKFRGPTSLRDNTPPLVVIDGVPVDHREIVGSRNPFNFVNARDVKDITILKDASAAAIYGARGANGVIIITTKSGTAGKLKVDYSANFNVTQFSGTPTNLSAANFRNAISAKAPQDLEFLGDANINWFDEVTQSGQNMEHSLAVSGGIKNFNYRLSGGYVKSNGVLINSVHEKTTLSANINTSLLNESLDISIHSKLGMTDDQYTPEVVGAALAFDPTRPILEEGSIFGGYFEWNDVLATTNPLSTIELQQFTGSSTRSLNNLKLDYHLPFVDGLSLSTNLSYDKTIGDKRNFTDPLYKNEVLDGTNGHLSLDDIDYTTQLMETYGTYKSKLGKAEKTSMTLTLGHAWQDFQRDQSFEFGDELVINESGEYEYTKGIKTDTINTHNRLISFFGRANFDIAEKYLLTASLRRDGSSRFGPENRWGLFPSAAVAWRVLQEP